MQIMIRGAAGRTELVRVDPSDTVADVKRKIQMGGIEVEDYWLLFAGLPLREDRCLAEYWIQKHSVLQLIYILILRMLRRNGYLQML